jgi:hypothetical protein
MGEIKITITIKIRTGRKKARLPPNHFLTGCCS